MSDFTKLENIYRIFSPAQELTAEKLDRQNSNDPTSIVRRLQDLLINVSNGSYNIDTIKIELENLTKGATPKQIQELNRWVTFYSSKGFLEFQKTSTRFSQGSELKGGLTFEQIVGVKTDELTQKPMSITQVRNGFVSPATRDASKVETFLNFMPSIILTQCVPYVEVEFVFDRPYDTNNTTSTPSLMKFLMGGIKINENDSTNPNTVMYKARYGSSGEITKEGEDKRRVQTSAGMELFTSPQTLINMDSDTNMNRYVPVLDPTRPFMTLESVTVETKGTTGVMSHKTANMQFKLHDRSRLSELSDMIQPVSYGRSTVWLTYGWRYPEGNDANDASGTYAEFINNNMLIKEAYGIVNSTFSFEQNGQVSMTLALFTKAASELRRATIEDDADFAKLKKKQEELAMEISRIRQVYNLDSTMGDPKEVRPFVVLSSAGSNTFPDLKANEVDAAIDQLHKSLLRAPKTPAGEKPKPPMKKSEAERLVKKLDEYYFGDGKNKGAFYFKSQVSTVAARIVKQKFEALAGSPDPFIVDTDQKSEVLLQEDMGYAKGVNYPYLASIKGYNAAAPVQGENIITGIKKDAVSFGKLFSVFMTPAIMSIDSVHECQIYFYNLNDLAGKAGGTNIAEFAIDLPEFLKQYKETLENTASTNMTIEQFIQLVVNAQIRDLRAIPYGFRNEGVLKPWDKKEPTTIQKGQEANFNSLAMSFNSGRGGFQQPEIEIFLETTYERAVGTDGPGDLLRNYQGSNAINAPYGSTTKRIMKVHVYDRTVDPFSKISSFFKNKNGNATDFITLYDPYDPYQRETSTKIEAKPNETDQQLTNRITSLNGQGSLRVQQLQTTGGPADRETVKNHVSKMIPTLIPGSNGSAILDVSMSTNSDPMLASVQMIGMGKGNSTVATPRGSNPANLPLRVIPVQLSMRTMGIPIIGFTQMFFVDMNTGTTIDNRYGVSGITHSFGPGKFETNLTFAAYDSYGRYESAPTVLDMINQTAEQLKETADVDTQNNPPKAQGKNTK